MNIEVTSAFPTLIGRSRVPVAEPMNAELQSLILAEEKRYASLGRSHVASWVHPYASRAPRIAVSFHATAARSSPIASIITPYSGGLTGWVPMAQLMFTF
jgi:hypothetical protein